MSESRPFAMFDIDGTLIRWQLFHAIVHHLGTEGYILRGTHEKIRAARMVWKNRVTDHGFHDYEQTLVDAYLAVLRDISVEDYLRIVDDVVAEYKDQTFTHTRDRLRELKEQNYLLFAISGSQSEAVERIAQYHGFDAAIGCEFERAGDQFTGNFTTPIFDKKAVLDRLVEQYGATYEQSYAFGDSMSDAPILAAVTHPVAFNPDQKLFAEAKKQHWPVVVERKNVVYELRFDTGGYILE